MNRYVQRGMVALTVPAALVLAAGAAEAKTIRNPINLPIPPATAQDCSSVVQTFSAFPLAFLANPSNLAVLLSTAPNCQNDLAAAIGAAVQNGMLTQAQADELDKAIGCDPSYDIGPCGHRIITTGQ